MKLIYPYAFQSAIVSLVSSNLAEQLHVTHFFDIMSRLLCVLSAPTLHYSSRNNIVTYFTNVERMATNNAPSPFRLRKATMEDISELTLLIDASVRALHAEHYTPEQISAALKHVYGVDTTLIQDGHYFVVETSAPEKVQIVGCGGWSYRRTLYGGNQYAAREDDLLDPAKDAGKIRAFFVHPDWTRRGIGGIVLRACEGAAREAGFARVEMGSTLSGVAFYTSSGYKELEQVEDRLENGVVLTFVRMGKVF
jgi:GNAT superfamily N-acetyltransferase